MVLYSPCPVTWWQTDLDCLPFFRRLPDCTRTLYFHSNGIDITDETSLRSWVCPSTFCLSDDPLEPRAPLYLRLYHRMKRLTNREPTWILHGVIRGTPRLESESTLKVSLLLAPQLLTPRFKYPSGTPGEIKLLTSIECQMRGLPYLPNSSLSTEIIRPTRFEREDVV
jgi:hypothetical protein